MVYYSVSRYNEDMFLVGILSWWYGNGWKQRLTLTLGRLSRISDFFSIGLLLSSLFAPFRQISAGGVSGSLGDQMRGLIDQLLSRFIGLFVRLFMIVFGVVTLLGVSLWGAVVLVVWSIVPIFPVIGLIATVIGWVPTWQ